MRISDDLRHCVVFIGFKDDTQRSSGIKCAGTAFLLWYKTFSYLVTVKHVAIQVGDCPFVIRMNRQDGTSDNIYVDDDDMRWYFNQADTNVDLAVTPFDYNLGQAGYNSLLIPDTILANTEILKSESIGIGDLCYTVGLFRLLAGEKRNLPVVHTGNIALLPGDERIPVQDWDAPLTNKRRHIEGYLVESQSIQGLSGSPVFVRTAIDLSMDPLMPGITARLARSDLYLLGVWQGAWDAPADEVLATDRGRELRVPVGMGVVVPATKLIEVLETPELQERRAEGEMRRESQAAAKPDASPISGS
jgi:hypothetical protein